MRSGTRLCAPHGVGVMSAIEDRLDMRKLGIGERELWIELDRLFIKLLRFLQIRLSLLVPGEEIVRLNVKQVSFAIFCRTTFQASGFPGRSI